MHGPETRRRTSAVARRAPVLLLLVACGLGALACAHAASPTGPSAGSAGPGRPPVSKARDLAATQRRQLGDYDDDEWTGRSDQDNDDKPTVDGDGDLDGGRRRYDADDQSYRTFGHAATASDRRAISALVRRYYAIAAAGDGAAACASIYVRLARSYPEALGEFGARYLRGLRTCPAILSRMFEPNRALLATYRARLQIGAVRVSKDIGLAFLTFRGLPTRKMEVIRERGTWKMYAALDSEMP